MKQAIIRMIVRIMVITGFRFSKDYRRGKTFYHRLVYHVLPCVEMNFDAGLPAFDKLVKDIYSK